MFKHGHGEDHSHTSRYASGKACGVSTDAASAIMDSSAQVTAPTTPTTFGPQNSGLGSNWRGATALHTGQGKGKQSNWLQYALVAAAVLGGIASFQQLKKG